jgi:hypothetical protein
MITRRLRLGLRLALAGGAGLCLLPAGAAAAGGAHDFSGPVPPSVQLREPTAQAERAAERTHGYGAHGPVLYRSRPIEAPQRFDLVGIADTMHPYEFRTRRDGGSWSRWAETDNGDPVYAGGADQLQIRSRAVPIAGRLHYVTLPPPSPSGMAAKARPRHGRPHVKERSVPAPKFVTRAQWGANAAKGGCQPKDKPDTGKIKAGVVHHTVNTNTYTQAEAPGIVLGICRFHRFGNGWDDIGYNALVDRFGTLYEGRAGGLSRPIIGAQAEGINTYTTGIASIGDNRSFAAPQPEIRTIVRYLAWKFDLARIPATGTAWLLSAGGETQRTPQGKRVRVPRVFSHNFTNFTACAGNALIAQVGKIRRGVQRRLDKYGAGESSGGDPAAPGRHRH